MIFGAGIRSNIKLMNIIYQYLLCKRAIVLVILSIGLFVFFQLVTEIRKDMNNLIFDYSYFQIKILFFSFNGLYFSFYFIKRLCKYSYYLNLVVKSFIWSVQGHVL